MSVISAANLSKHDVILTISTYTPNILLAVVAVENTVFSNTAGTAPAAGVDLEPDFPHEGMTNISFKDCSLPGNAGGGFQIYLGTYNASAKPFSVRLTNMQITGGGSFGFGFGGLAEGVRGAVTVSDSVVQGVPSSPVLIFRRKGLSNSASFQNCRFIDSCGTKPTCAPIALDMNPGINTSIGNISFTDCQVEDAVDRPWLRATPGFSAVITTRMRVTNPHGCTTEGLKLPVQCGGAPPRG